MVWWSVLITIWTFICLIWTDAFCVAFVVLTAFALHDVTTATSTAKSIPHLSSVHCITAWVTSASNNIQTCCGLWYNMSNLDEPWMESGFFCTASQCSWQLSNVCFFNLCRLVLHVAVPHVVSNCIAMHQLLSRAQLTRHHSYKIIAGSQRHFSDCVWQSVHGFPMFFLTNYKVVPQSKSNPLALLQFPMGIAAWASQHEAPLEDSIWRSQASGTHHSISTLCHDRRKQ